MPPDCKAWLCALALVCQQLPAAVTISDTSIPGNPLVFVNAEFGRLTGYAEHEVLGRNCRFLQGKMSEAGSMIAMKEAIRKGMASYCVIVNYRSDGSTFRNLVAL